MTSKTILTLALLSLLATPAVTLAQDEPSQAPGVAPAGVPRKLSSRSPFERRTAAEELARLAAVEHRRLVEGYPAQERDSRVKLALDWALYRLGMNETTFELVKVLDEKGGAG